MPVVTAACRGAAPSGEGVGRFGMNLVDFRHRQPSQLRLIADDAVQLRVILPGDGMGLGHAQRNPVAEPVSPEVHSQSEYQSDDDACLAADDAAHHNQQRRQRHHQEKSL